MADLGEAMAADSGRRRPGELRVDGGMTRNELLMQFQADILGRPVVAPPLAEISALGAAYAAGLAVGFWGGLDELRAMDRVERRWEPSMAERDSRAAGMARWHKGVERTPRLGGVGRYAAVTSLQGDKQQPVMTLPRDPVLASTEFETSRRAGGRAGRPQAAITMR